MQRIDRYGLIALVLLVASFAAVALWGEGQGAGLFSADRPASEPQREPSPATAARGNTGERARDRAREQAERARAAQRGGEPSLPLSATTVAQVDPTAPRPQAARPGGGDARRAGRTAGEGARAESGRAPAQGSGGGAQPRTTPPATTTGAVSGPETRLVSTTAPSGEAGRAGRRGAPVERRLTRTYKVRTGDTLGEIAGRELGASRRWPEIVELNPGVDPRRLKVDSVLRLPMGSAPAAAPSGRTASRTSGRPSGPGPWCQVKPGDTLGGISQACLGKASRWREIQGLNPGIDPVRLRVGAWLRLPTGASARSASSAPSGSLVASARQPDRSSGPRVR